MKAAQARVLLTGACGGIGQTAALALAEAGAALLLVGRSPARLAAQARAIQQRVAGAQVAWLDADLVDAGSIPALVVQARAFACNVVIHGAGVAEFGHFEDAKPDAMARLLSTNLLAPMVLTQALLPHLRTLPQAQVICVGSALGAIGLPGYSVYCASKFGLRGFAQALRRELADTQVRIQYLGPRSTKTGFNSAEVAEYNRGTGTAMDSPEVVALGLVRLLESGAAERFLGFPEKVVARLNGLAPAAMDGAFSKHRQNLPHRHALPITEFNEETRSAN